MSEKKRLGVWIEVKSTLPGKRDLAFFFADGIAKEWKKSITFNMLVAGEKTEKITIEKKHIISIETMEEE